MLQMLLLVLIIVVAFLFLQWSILEAIKKEKEFREDIQSRQCKLHTWVMDGRNERRCAVCFQTPQDILNKIAGVRDDDEEEL